MADQNDPQQKPDDTQGQMTEISRAKRDLISRREDVTNQLAKLQTAINELEEGSPLAMVKDAIDIEIKKQENIKGQLEEFTKEIRELRKKKNKLSESRNTDIAAIRDLQLTVAAKQQVLKDPEASKEQKAQAKEDIQELQESYIPAHRLNVAEYSAEISKINTDISSKLGDREEAESDLSSSRSNVRELKAAKNEREQLKEKVGKTTIKESKLQEDIAEYEERRAVRETKAAERVTPQSVMREAMARRELDPKMEAAIATQKFEKKGATGLEADEYSETVESFIELVNQIKATKKALAELEEGTEEYQEKQEELKDFEDQAHEKAQKMGRMERFQELRRTDTPGARRAEMIGGAVQGAFQFGAAAFGALGGQATERYTTEEQAKQSELRLRGQSFQDFQNRTTDATAFLSTGGGKLFGAEMPFDDQGNVTGRIQKLGKDVANTREAVKQHEFVMDTLGGAANVMTNAVAGGFRGAAAGSATGIGAAPGAAFGAAGEFVQGSAQLARRTFERGMMTPEVGGRFGGEGLAEAVHEGFASAIGDATRIGQGVVGTMLEKGGGDVARGEKAVGMLGKAGTDYATALPKLMDRAYEAVEMQNRLISANVQGQQVGNVRERLQMAFAPAMQSYMDVQGNQRQALRSRVASRAERESEEMRLEGGMLDPELGERGFGMQEITARQAQAAQTFGRFGAGGKDISAARTAMMAESAGLGPAQQSIGAMGKMLQGGVEDPESMFRKAMAEGMQKGLQDSRQFQQLLEFAGATADSTIGFEGALEGILKASGSGRAGDLQTAAAAYGGIAEDMSGSTGTWTDMVKFETTSKAASKAIEAGRASGVEVGRDDITTLQNLANFSLDDLKNPEFVKSALTPNARRAVEASHGSVEKYAEGLRNSLITRGTFDRAINATQSAELVQVRDMIDKGDKEGVKKMFGQHEGATAAEKAKGQETLERVGAQLVSGSRVGKGSTDEALGSQQIMRTSLQDMGVDTSAMPMGRAIPKVSADQAMTEGRAANTFSEQQGRAGALVDQEKGAYAIGKLRDAEGRNIGAEEMGRDPVGRFREQQAKIAADTVGATTVDPSLKVERIDTIVKDVVDGLKELKASFKDFSAGDFVVNAAKDVVIQGAQAISGVILDNGVTRAASEVGRSIVDAVKDGIGGITGSGGNKNPTPSAKTGGSVPNPGQ